MDQLEHAVDQILVSLDDSGRSVEELGALLEGVVTTPQGKAALGYRLSKDPCGESLLQRLGSLVSNSGLAVHLVEVEGERRAAILRRQSFVAALDSNTDTIVAGIELNGRIGFCNAAGTDATGLESGDSIIKFAGAFDQGELDRVLGEFAKGSDKTQWSATLQTRSSGTRHFDFSMIANRVAGEIVSFSLIGYDVTDLRSVEAALKEGQDFLQDVIDASPDAIQVADAEGRMILSNAAARAVFVGSDNGRSMYSPDGKFLERHDKPLARALATGESVLAEVLTRGDDGPRTWESHAKPMYDEDGKVRGAVAVSRDVSASRAIAAAAGERQAFIRSVLQSTDDAVVAVDRSLNIQFVNSSASEIFGYAAEQANILDSPSDIISIDGVDPSGENLPLERALRGETGVHVEMVMVGSGKPVILAGLSNPITDDDDNVIGAVGVYRDVTAEREEEQRDASRREFIFQMLDSLTQPLAALNILNDEEYLNTAARTLGIPGPGSDLPLPFTHPDGTPIDDNLLFEAMTGSPREQFEIVHPDTNRVYVASTRAVESSEGVLGGVFTARDITELRGVVEQLEVQSAAMESTITAMFITDSRGIIEWVNGAFTAMSGFSAEESLGQTPQILKSGLHDQAHYADLWDTILAGQPWQGRVTNRRADGGHYVVEQWITPVIDVHGHITHFVSVQDDVTSEVEAERHMLHIATHDALTDLPNRRLFLEHLDLAIGRAQRSKGSLAVLMMDLDKFKDVNDTLGHPAGDTLLREVAKRVRARVRGTDVVARLGGDEFAVIVDEATIDGARVVARDIIIALSKEFEILGHGVRTGATIGLAMFAPDTSAEQLLDRADLALYAAKDAERGTLQVYVPEMGEHTRQRAELSGELRGAISREELSLVYQPIFDIESGTVTSVEALLRWIRPDGTALYPNDFLGAAAETGLLPSLGRWVLDSVCSQAAEWAAAGLDAPPIAVNASPQELRNRGWARSLSRALKRANLDPSMLAIEVTGAGLLVAAEENLAALSELRGQGLHLTLDDFGTGASSLMQFRRIPFDRIKMDRLFVRDVHQVASTGAIIQASSLLAGSVGARLVAKGVESMEQLVEVHRLGAHEVQGFLLERPLEASEIVEHFHRRHPVLDRAAPPLAE